MDPVEITMAELLAWKMEIAPKTFQSPTENQPRFQKILMHHINAEMMAYFMMYAKNKSIIAGWCHTLHIFCTNSNVTSMWNASDQSRHSNTFINMFTRVMIALPWNLEPARMK